jgi:hypothetical protein
MRKSWFGPLARKSRRTLSAREQAGLAQQTSDDFGYRASDASFRHSTYRRETGNYLTKTRA